jgi:hypothetical protein
MDPTYDKLKSGDAPEVSRINLDIYSALSSLCEKYGVSLKDLKNLEKIKSIRESCPHYAEECEDGTVIRDCNFLEMRCFIEICPKYKLNREMFLEKEELLSNLREKLSKCEDDLNLKIKLRKFRSLPADFWTEFDRIIKAY